MKYLILSISFGCLLLPQVVFSQLTQDTRKNLPTEQKYHSIKKYKAAVILHNQQEIKGLLLKANDQEVVLIPKDQYYKRYAHFVKLVRNNQTRILLPNVLLVETSRVGKKGIGFGIGAVLGLVLSDATDGLIPSTSAAGVIGITGGLLGFFIGAIPSKTYELSDKKELEELKKKGIMY